MPDQERPSLQEPAGAGLAELLLGRRPYTGVARFSPSILRRRCTGLSRGLGIASQNYQRKLREVSSKKLNVMKPKSAWIQMSWSLDTCRRRVVTSTLSSGVTILSI